MAPEVSDLTERDGEIRVVFLDIGGVMYDDSVYARSWARALRESGAVFTDEEFDAEYAAARAAQAGSFRRRLTSRFLGPDADSRAGGGDREASTGRTRPTALYPDVLPVPRAAGRPVPPRCPREPAEPWCGRRWSATASTGSWRCGACPTTSGSTKPDPRFFAHVLYLAGVAPPHAVMVGDRLDYDVRPATARGHAHRVGAAGRGARRATRRAARRARRGGPRDSHELPGALERDVTARCSADPHRRRRVHRDVRGAAARTRLRRRPPRHAREPRELHAVPAVPARGGRRARSTRARWWCRSGRCCGGPSSSDRRGGADRPRGARGVGSAARRRGARSRTTSSCSAPARGRGRCRSPASPSTASGSRP